MQKIFFLLRRIFSSRIENTRQLIQLLPFLSILNFFMNLALFCILFFLSFLNIIKSIRDHLHQKFWIIPHKLNYLIPVFFTLFKFQILIKMFIFSLELLILIFNEIYQFLIVNILGSILNLLPSKFLDFQDYLKDSFLVNKTLVEILAF